MQLTRSLLAIFLNLSLVFVLFLTLNNNQVFAQDSRIALQRGYRTGYSDGYMAGYRDVIDNSAKDFQRHGEYAKADRAYNKDYGSINDYRDGYQQGFEAGYSTGFEKRSFDATIPSALNKRGVVAPVATAATTAPETTAKETSPDKTAVEAAQMNKVDVAPATPAPDVSNNTVEQKTVETKTVETGAANPENRQPPSFTAATERNNPALSGGEIVVIPVETELIVELLDDINTEQNREGDKFKARVVSPNELNGAIIEGRIGKIQKPGRIKRRAEMSLSFDRIVLSENRWSNFHAILTEVLPVKGDNVTRVDTEGTVEGKRSVKTDSIKVGATTGTGLVVGAIVGGPAGAAIGAGVGAAYGVGAVVVERGKHIRLNKNQQLRIKTAYETQIR